MAITKDPLKVSSMVDTKKTDFGNMTDTIKKQAAALKDNINNSINKAKKSVLNKVQSVTSSMEQIGSSSFTDIMCCSLPSKALRTDLYHEALDRGLGGTSEDISICELSKIKNPMDAALKVTSIINDYPGLLQGNMEDRLKYLIQSDLLAKMDIFGLGNVIPQCVLGQTINTMSGTSRAVGANIHDKNELRSLMQQNACGAALANWPLVSGWLSNSVSANLINVIIDSKQNGLNLYRFLDAGLLATGQRNSVIGGLIGSITAATSGANTKLKADAIHYVAKNGGLSAEEFNKLKLPAKELVSKLDQEAEGNKNKIDGVSAGSTTPEPGAAVDVNESSSSTINRPTYTEEFQKLLETIGILDPTWKLWDITGAKTVCQLANKTLKSKEIKNIELSTDVKTELTPELMVAIGCRFNKVA